MNLLKTLASVSGMTLLSRIAGLVRETLTARIFGAGATTDAFFIAFRIPNLLRRLFAEGAFSQAFIPLLAQSKNTNGQDATKALVDHVATVLFWVVSMITILGIVFVNAVLAFMASGLMAGSEPYNQAALMTQIMFPYIVFMALSALFAGVLNTWKNFNTPAFTPVLLNLVLISSMIWLSPHMNPPILGLAIGVFVGGFVQLAWQIPALRKIGMLPKISFNLAAAFRDAGVRRVLKQMVPATLAVSVAQISLIINTNIATHLGAGAVSWITYADRLMEFPTAMLGVALGTILLPSLSRAHSTSDEVEYKTILNWGLRLTLLLALPSAVGLGCLSVALTSSLFHYGHFSANDVMKTSQALSMYAIGLVGLIAVKILAAAYYAKQDIKTPVKIAIVVLAATQGMNLIFVPIFGHAGLSLSIGLGACLNAAILCFLLARRGALGGAAGWLPFFTKLCLALLVLALVAYGLGRQVDWLGLGQAVGFAPKIERLATLFGIIIVSAGAYFAVLFGLGFRLRDFKLVAKG
ncbi:murein biosynthesis integral membrane protein MurJ [Hydromonas duriensis]|uniref:Probable lipid II flippase MurJ n=1 Tax=Hydromonas duriensis TaxID=1527608 RepID=A0A4R6Y7V0_9BURK|nr:murein biosynthesis integral membrane protein MurJ [Hydromonas duriensis]TDR31432.1 putative peptidoglycan lipid II flippase [Hydromonas duriensis]